MWRERIWATLTCTAQSAQVTRWKSMNSAGSVWSCGKARPHALTSVATPTVPTLTWSFSRAANLSSSVRLKMSLRAPPSGPVPPAVRNWSMTKQAARTSSVLAVRKSFALCVSSSLLSAWKQVPTSIYAAVALLHDRPPYLCGAENKGSFLKHIK